MSGTDDPPRIVLVGDPRVADRTLAEVLADEGFRVETTGGAREALALVEGVLREAGGPGIDLLVVDLSDPDLKGVELVQTLRVKRVTDRIPLWAFVDSPRDEPGYPSVRFEPHGIRDVLHGQLVADELTARVRAHVEGTPERRRNPRVSVYLRAEYEADRRPGEGHIIFLSAEGAFLQTGDLLEVDTPLRVRFSLPSTGARLSIRARVLYRVLREPEDPSFLSHGMGLRFEDFDDGGRGILETFLQKTLDELGSPG